MQQESAIPGSSSIACASVRYRRQNGRWKYSQATRRKGFPGMLAVHRVLPSITDCTSGAVDACAGPGAAVAIDQSGWLHHPADVGQNCAGLMAWTKLPVRF